MSNIQDELLDKIGNSDGILHNASNTINIKEYKNIGACKNQLLTNYLKSKKLIKIIYKKK